MKLIGALLILGTGLWSFLLYKREWSRSLKQCRLLLEDLRLIRGQICAFRRPLPQLLRDLPLGAPLWRPFHDFLEEERGTASEGWENALPVLPEALRPIAAPLGRLFSLGGRELEEGIDEVRKELSRYLERGEREALTGGRLCAACCLSGAGLAVLLLL